jgi:hypothetical protein
MDQVEGAISHRGTDGSQTSPLEEAGFKLSVPPAGAGLFAANGTEKTVFRERCRAEQSDVAAQVRDAESRNTA